MSGVKPNTPSSGLDQGDGNYDYLQHTTIHVQPNPPSQPQVNYYQTQHGGYPTNQHQYYQQPYYQQPPQGPWSPSPNTMQNNQYQQYYHQPHHPDYSQNQPYQQPAIHQLSSFVNHSHAPQVSPPPAAMYPVTTTASSGYASQMSPNPQRSVSPVRPGPGSSPGTTGNHMMPVRLQNMTKGARTKAGMRQLLQMERQGQGLQSSPLDTPVMTSPKKKRNTKKRGGTPPMASHDTSSGHSLDESIESVVFSVIPSQPTEITSTPIIPANPGPHLPLPRTQQNPMSPSVTSVCSSSSPLPTPRVSIDDTFSHDPIPLPQFNTPKPSDLLYEKLGLALEENETLKKSDGKSKSKKSTAKLKNQVEDSPPVKDIAVAGSSSSPKRNRRSQDSAEPQSPPKRKRSESPPGNKGSPDSKRASSPRKSKEPTTKTFKGKLNKDTTEFTPKGSGTQRSQTPPKIPDVTVCSSDQSALPVVQPTSTPPAKKSKAKSPAQSEPSDRIKRKYTKRDPKRWKSLQKLEVPLIPSAASNNKKASVAQGISVVPIETPVGKAKKTKPRSPSKGKKAKAAKTERLSVSSSQSDLQPEFHLSPRPNHGASDTPSGSRWIESMVEKKLTVASPKKPTVRSKVPPAAGPGGATEGKKEQGPSLKVKRGTVKFYRGNVEEDVDEALKKLDVVLKDTVAKDCEDEDGPWICTFCGLGPHDMRLGDLFGPYFVQESTGPNLRTKPGTTTKREVWVHTDCALWAGDVILVGSTLRNLDEAVIEAGKVVCNICKNVGATIGCLKRGCRETAHYPCAQLNDWSLNGDTFHSHCKVHYPQVQ